jgi:hypothetical protein
MSAVIDTGGPTLSAGSKLELGQPLSCRSNAESCGHWNHSAMCLSEVELLEGSLNIGMVAVQAGALAIR